MSLPDPTHGPVDPDASVDMDDVAQRGRWLAAVRAEVQALGATKHALDELLRAAGIATETPAEG